ncbi:murein L,D-transpeptidase catalytic domain-containing protein [Rhizobium leguminosarum]
MTKDQSAVAIDQERARTLPQIDKTMNTYARKLTDSDSDRLRTLAKQFGIDPAPIKRPIAFEDKERPYARLRYWAVLDFALRSDQKRLSVLDMVEQSVDRYYCFHGKGSEGSANDGYATVFSNRSSSNASSLGIYTCAGPYDGDNGYSMRLDGEEATNSNARSRAVVMHGANYVSDQWLRHHPYLGRSSGCPSVGHAYASKSSGN